MFQKALKFWRYWVYIWSSSPFTLLNIHFLFIVSDWQIKDLKKGVRKFAYVSYNTNLAELLHFKLKSRISSAICKETDIKWVTKWNRKILHTLFEAILLSIISESFKAIALSACEVKTNCCLFERLFKVKKNGIFLLGISFSFLEIFTFLYYANEDSD